MKLTCKEAARLISEGLDRNLNVAERAALHLHVGICVACERVTRQFEFLRRAARRYPGPDDERKE
ncbi:MAG TPA: zf-HC2 domain-containing protein [Burkholderiales bacterium]|nr:zf-HC2 domain-containing protein [Burkholderiales bacterium]